MWCVSLALPVSAKVVILAILAIIVPVAVYHLIEHPMILVGKKLAKRLFERSAKQSPAIQDIENSCPAGD
jgi:peptidoglycan/LPS O-acetylase OafA/YrhL